MSFARTLVVDARGINYLQWPAARVNEALDYYLDVSAPLTYDLISNIFVSASPYGEGELRIDVLSAEGSIIRLGLDGGVAGRTYRIRINCITELGREFSWVAVLPFSAEGSIGPIPIAPNAGFGPDTTWIYSGPVRPIPTPPSRPPVVFNPTPFTARTINIDAKGINYLQWPLANINDELDYFFDASEPLAYDLLSSVSASVFPSGAGELQITSLTAEGSVIRVQFSGGVAGRIYKIRLNCITELSREFSWFSVLPFSKEGAILPLPIAPIADFGTPVVWNYSGPVRPIPVQPTRPPVTFNAAPYLARTVTINPRGENYLQWPIGAANDELDYYLDTVAAIYHNGDEISSLRISTAPSGTGEISISNISMNDGIIRIDFTGGVPGRLYRVRVDVNTLLGRDYSWIINLPISKEYFAGPFPVAPNPGFGTVATWAMIALENGQGFWRLEDDLGNWVWG
jgi:hypothetical protein